MCTETQAIDFAAGWVWIQRNRSHRGSVKCVFLRIIFFSQKKVILPYYTFIEVRDFLLAFESFEVVVFNETGHE